MSVSTGCNKCKRKSEVENPPWALVDFGSPVNVSMAEMEFIVKQNFDGDLAEHCSQAVTKALAQFIIDQLTDSQAPPDRCYRVAFEGLKVQAQCECNDEDIEEGKGPPKADIEIEISSGHIVETPCPEPPTGGGPPNMG